MVGWGAFGEAIGIAGRDVKRIEDAQPILGAWPRGQDSLGTRGTVVDEDYFETLAN